jgi:hypothetical protein
VAWLARASLLCSRSSQNKMMWQQPQPVVTVVTNEPDWRFEGELCHPMARLRVA